jgi:hypothetical protein
MDLKNSWNYSLDSSRPRSSVAITRKSYIPYHKTPVFLRMKYYFWAILESPPGHYFVGSHYYSVPASGPFRNTLVIDARHIYIS